jgi:hypothetical protein
VPYAISLPGLPELSTAYRAGTKCSSSEAPIANQLTDLIVVAVLSLTTEPYLFPAVTLSNPALATDFAVAAVAACNEPRMFTRAGVAPATLAPATPLCVSMREADIVRVVAAAHTTTPRAGSRNFCRRTGRMVCIRDTSRP